MNPVDDKGARGDAPRLAQRPTAMACMAAVALASACASPGPGAANGVLVHLPMAPPAQASLSAPAPAPPVPVTCDLPNFRVAVLHAVNEVRAHGAECGSHGRFGTAPALVWNEALTAAAIEHSRDMADHNYLEHEARDGTTPSARADSHSYAWSLVAENIAGGQASVPEVIESWLRSPGHCANLMQPALKDVGVACVRATGARYSTYWTMVLGTPLSPKP